MKPTKRISNEKQTNQNIYTCDVVGVGERVQKRPDSGTKPGAEPGANGYRDANYASGHHYADCAGRHNNPNTRGYYCAGTAGADGYSKIFNKN